MAPTNPPATAVNITDVAGLVAAIAAGDDIYMYRDDQTLQAPGITAAEVEADLIAEYGITAYGTEQTASALATKLAAMAPTGYVIAAHDAADNGGVTVQSLREEILKSILVDEMDIGIVEVRVDAFYDDTATGAYSARVSADDAGVVVVKAKLQGNQHDPRWEVISAGNLKGYFISRDWCSPLRWHGLFR